MKTLHFDCRAGISGDMVLGALVDLGVNPGELKAELDKLGVSGWKLDFAKEERCGIAGTRALVDAPSVPHQHDHDHQHAHHHHEHDTAHHDDHAHHHDHTHEHHEHAHHSWKEIRALIGAAPLKDGAKARALDIFSRIAAAESEVHGVPADDIAFHEVGALDSIIDITGAAVCLDLLAPRRITAGTVELGGGFVRCAHGILPVPAPATLKLCAGLPVHTGGFDREMTTPTGAAILASCVDEFVDAASFREIKTAYGIGSRTFDKPNVLAVSWREEAALEAEKADDWLSEELFLLETNIDDLSGEELAFVMERLFEEGALDVTMTPCVMKKSRPAAILAALGSREKLPALRRAFFQFAAIGFRETKVLRHSLRREEAELRGGFGTARIKRAFLDGKILREKIEAADRAALARARNISLAEADALIRGKTARGESGERNG